MSAHLGIGPWHITGINVAGSGLLGVLSTHPAVGPKQRACIGVGFCGAPTTYSTFSVDTVKLLESGHLGSALAYVTASNVGAVGAAYAGMRLGRKFPPKMNSQVTSPVSRDSKKSKGKTPGGG